MNPALDDEITSINSIYTTSDPSDSASAEPTLSILTATATSRICALRLPSLPSISLRLEFPPDYPDAPPSVLGTQSVGPDAPKGFGTRVVDVVRGVLAVVYQPGEPCVFGLVEEVGELLERERERERERGRQEVEEQDGAHQEAGLTTHHHHGDADGNVSRGEFDQARSSGDADDGDGAGLGPDPAWVLSQPLTEKKSVFLGRAARVASPAQAKQYVRHLLATDKKAAKATHNITAWRIRGEGEAVFQDCDDDGETAAGGRVLHLLQLMDVWDVVVVVTRWYGGVLLGPDRFRIINQAARDAVVSGGWVKDGKEGKEGAGKKKGRK